MTLINAKELRDNLAQYTIVDLRSKREYDTAHILGAVSLPAGDAPFKTTIGPPDVATWASSLGRCGITHDTPLVVYDDGASGRAVARFWYVAKYYGHSNVFILNGGFGAALGMLPTSTDAPQVTPAIYTPVLTLGYILDLRGAMDNYGKATFLDVRSPEEYAGTELRGNPRGGHIPGAILAVMDNFFADAPGQSFADPKKLAQTMANLGMRKSDFIITY